jgi:YesN/AraC family two-component response regulator
MPGTEVRAVRMLLVDDDPSMLKLVRTIVERSFLGQVSVAVAEDPRVAREMIEGSPVDIVITDMEMPGISGLEIVRAAKRRNAYTQVLMLTGHSTVASLLDAMELGATDYLLKPLDKESFIAVLTETMNRLERWRKALSGTYAAKAKAQTEQVVQTAS